MSRRALVVGSGPNGLAAAITLAQSGHQVLVLEAAPAPGGAVATEQLTLPGFWHDTFSAVHPAAVASPVFAAMPLERHGLRWIQPDACYAHPLSNGRAIALYRDLDRTVASLDAAAPGAGDSWRQFAAPYIDRFEAMRAALLASFPPVRPVAGLLGALGPRRVVELARIGSRSAEALGRELFADAGARAWLYGSAMHGDVPVTARGSAIPALFLNLLGHGVGWPSPEGGAGRLTDALVGYLESLGGSVRTSAEVVEIAASRGRVGGVRLADGEPVAGELVIADVMPGALAALARSALPPRYARALSRYRPGPATLKLDWALDGPIPWIAAEARRAGTVHLGGDEDQLLRSGWHRGAAPERPFMLLGQQSIADPTRAPDGKHTAWGYIRGPQSADWAEARDRLVERVEAQVERFAPGFRELILARHLLAPADLQRRNANLIGGDVGGGSYRLWQVVFRPVARPVPYATPVGGLYIASAATFPGGAVHGVPGRAAATLAIRRTGR